MCAHTHIPSFKRFNDKIFINVGSVGKPKIGKPNPTYSIIEINDLGEVKASFRYLEYEFRKIVKDCTMLKFPTSLVDSYKTGQE